MNPEQLNRILEAKAERRRAEDELNGAGTDKYCCRTCFHLKVAACDGLSNPSKVCEQWYSPDSEIQGLAYWRQEAGSKNNRAGVVAAVKDYIRGKRQRPHQQHQQQKVETPNLWRME